MLYSLLKIPARIAFPFYCRKLKVNHPELFSEKGPLLIAANHPNSFLDAVVLATLFKRPIYSLVRGDVYTNNFYTRILTSLKMLPVYRLSEGAENLYSNYATFEKCKSIFRDGGIVLIFSEGRCVNEWKLRPLRKGTARLALSAWQDDIPLRVLPTGINFSSFRKFGKNIHIRFQEPFENRFQQLQDGKAVAAFNEHLQKNLSEAVYNIADDDKAEVIRKFNLRHTGFKKIMLGLPALAGWILIAPLYYPIRSVVRKKWNNGHFDSLVVAMLFLIFPFYLVLLTIAGLVIIPGAWGLLIPVIAAAGCLALLHLKIS